MITGVQRGDILLMTVWNEEGSDKTQMWEGPAVVVDVKVTSMSDSQKIILEKSEDRENPCVEHVDILVIDTLKRRIRRKWRMGLGLP